MQNHTPRTIGFVTSAEHRNLVSDDLIVAAALQQRKVTVVPVVWTEVAPQDVDCDLLMLRSVWDYHLHPDAFLTWVDEAHQRVPVANPVEVVRWNMDKHYIPKLEAAGINVPRTLVLEQGDEGDLDQLMDRAGFTEAVIKPAISASAFETHLVRREDAVSFNSKLNALLRTRAVLIQEFVTEIKTGGEWSLIFLGGKYSHAVRKLPRDGDFRVQHEHGGMYRAAQPSDAILQSASDVMARFAPDVLYARVDVIERGREVVLMELELIDPLLHFEVAPQAAEHMAELLTQIVFRNARPI